MMRETITGLALLAVVISTINTPASAAARTARATPGTALETTLASTVVVRTRSGALRGAHARGIYRFQGVAYGADTAARRFRAPEPVQPWDGVRDAIRPGPACPQNAEIELDAISEDCLRLNLWTPGVGESAKRPVLVYFHGGGYSHGAVNDPVYDGGALSRRGDVVVVTVHHRIGGFGFLYLANFDRQRYAESGNVGMLDLVLALAWVRDNIAAFGGDPGRVTIFGQSGGGAKCATLMAMPAARGLFHGVWTMSGQQVTGRTRAHAEETSHAILAALRLPPDRVRELETMPMQTALDAMRGGVWTPVVDGIVLPRDPFAPDAPAQSRRIPMVLGNTLTETTSLIGAADRSTFTLDWAALPNKLDQHVAQFLGQMPAATVIERYRQWYPQASPSQVFFAATTAARSWRGMLIESERRAAQGAPTWNYYVHWQSPFDDGRFGAPHTIDIPLVFNNVAASPYTDDSDSRAGSAQALADQMSDALLAFARTGDPNVSGLPPWPRFDLKQRAAMIFDAQSKVGRDPRRRERLLFAPVPYLQPGT